MAPSHKKPDRAWVSRKKYELYNSCTLPLPKPGIGNLTYDNDTSTVLLRVIGRDFSSLTIGWQSVTNRNYIVGRSTNLVSSVSFTNISEGLPGCSGGMSFTDTNVTTPGPYFYRLEIGR